MKFETLEFKREGHVGILTINRPQALNALNAQVLKDLHEFLIQVVEEKDLRALIVTGQGEKAFVAGADIKELEALDPAAAQKLSENGQQVFQQFEELKIPTMAAVNGFALGGGLELAMACDFIIAANTAKLGLPEVSLGLIPGYGGTQRISRCAGKGVARLITFTGDLFSAEQCLQWGLVSVITEPQDLLPTCMKIAGNIAKRSPQAVTLSKKAIVRGFEMSQAEGMKCEAQLFHEAFSSLDKREGVRAFIEKRPPQFTGK